VILERVGSHRCPCLCEAFERVGAGLLRSIADLLREATGCCRARFVMHHIGDRGGNRLSVARDRQSYADASPFDARHYPAGHRSHVAENRVENASILALDQLRGVLVGQDESELELACFREQGGESFGGEGWTSSA
jgi:hypothetical protein